MVKRSVDVRLGMFADLVLDGPLDGVVMHPPIHFVGFSTSPTNWLSKIIRRVTKSEASHAFVVYYDDSLEMFMVLEAGIKGVVMLPFDQFWGANTIVALYEPKIDLMPSIRKMAKELGDDYDFFGLIGMIPVMLGRWLHRQWKNPLQSSKAWFCSELVAQILVWAKHPGWEQIDEAEDVSPQDLMDLMHTHCG